MISMTPRKARKVLDYQNTIQSYAIHGLEYFYVIDAIRIFLSNNFYIALN